MSSFNYIQCIKMTSTGVIIFCHSDDKPAPNCIMQLYSTAEECIIICQYHLIYKINILRLRQNGDRFADNAFKRIFLNENVRISIKISLKFVPKGPIYNNPALVQIMAWCRSGNKPLSEPMMVSLLTHICVTQPQWVNSSPPVVAHMHQWIGSALAWCLFRTKPLSEPVLVYY